MQQTTSFQTLSDRVKHILPALPQRIPLILALVLITGFADFFFAAISVAAQTVLSIIRISENSQGVGQNEVAGRPVLSANGRLIAFATTADNLVQGDNDNRSDIYVRSLVSDGIRRVSTGRFGVAANGGSFSPSISPQAPNGFVVVAYASDASNIGRALNRFPDDNGVRDIYVSLPTRGDLTRRVTYGLGGVAPNGPSRDPSVTIKAEPNRILVAYHSEASNLVEGDSNGVQDVFLTTFSGSENDDDDDSFNPGISVSTIRVSRPNTPGIESDGASSDAQISGDGRFVVYESTATNLTAGTTSSERQIYLYDIERGITSLVSRGVDGLPANGGCRNPTINFRGTFIAFITRASNLFSDGAQVGEGVSQVALLNRNSGKLQRINIAPDGNPGNGATAATLNAAVSPNGRFVLFSDNADNLVTADLNAATDVFLRDLANAETIRVPRGLDGSEPNGASNAVTLGLSSFTAQEVSVGFNSSASNLVTNDSEGNNDVFVASLAISPVRLTKRTTLEVPPDVAVSGTQSMITMESFAGASLSALQRAAQRQSISAVPAFPRRRPRTTVQYEVQIRREREDGKLVDLRRRISKRNTFTFKNLKSGTHVVRYRTLIAQGGIVKRRSNFSPENRIAVEGAV